MNKCSFDPMIYADQPIGMFHCPECGEMVVAGMSHPDYSVLDEVTIKDLFFEEQFDSDDAIELE